MNVRSYSGYVKKGKTYSALGNVVVAQKSDDHWAQIIAYYVWVY